MRRSAGIMMAAAALIALAAGPPAGAAQSEPEVDVLTVSGHGEVRVSPDVALARVGVETRSARAADAIQENNRLMGQVIQAIRGLNIPERNIQTVTYNVSQQYEPAPDPTKQPPRLIYVVDNIVSVRVPEPARAGAVIDAATGAGANVVQGISFVTDKESEARAQALQQAVQDAQAKAEVIARALGVRVTGVQNVIESGAPIIFSQRMETAVAGAAAKTPVLPGENTIQADVTVRYRIAK